MCNDSEPSSRANPFTVDYAAITLEELAEHKMEKGESKYGNPDNYQTAAMLIRYIRHIGEFLTSVEDMNHSQLLEYIADIQNVGSLLYPKIQEDMIQKEYEDQLAEEELKSHEPN